MAGSRPSPTTSGRPPRSHRRQGLPSPRPSACRSSSTRRARSTPKARGSAPGTSVTARPSPAHSEAWPSHVVNHTYTAAGNYTVTWTVQDEQGATATATTTARVAVTEWDGLRVTSYECYGARSRSPRRALVTRDYLDLAPHHSPGTPPARSAPRLPARTNPRKITSSPSARNVRSSPVGSRIAGLPPRVSSSRQPERLGRRARTPFRSQADHPGGGYTRRMRDASRSCAGVQ